MSVPQEKIVKEKVKKNLNTRRRFIQSSLLMMAGTMTPFSLSLAQGRRVERPGLQLYTLRADMSRDFEGTLARVAELGYKEMEFAGYFNKSPSQVRSILDQNGLTSPASHIQLTEVRDNLEETIETAVAIGQKYIVVPIISPNERSLSDYQRHAETLNRAGEACRRAGIRMGYHNHDFEFVETSGRIPYDVLLEETDPDLVDFELDLYWIKNAGKDYSAYFEKHPGRFSMLHVKDMDEFGRMVEVGRGTIDFAEIFSHQDSAGIEHFFVEHDRPVNGLASVADSLYTLRNMTF